MFRPLRFRLLTLLIATAVVAGGLTLWIKTRPKLALDGYCPVSLVRDNLWKPGDPEVTATYRGQLFYFANPQNRQDFKADPKPYAPVMEGADVASLFDAGQRAPGERRFGYRYSGRMFLFEGADTMKRFRADPAKYLALVDQAESGR